MPLECSQSGIIGNAISLAMIYHKIDLVECACLANAVLLPEGAMMILANATLTRVSSLTPIVKPPSLPSMSAMQLQITSCVCK